jgi:hypothetical protein
LTVLSDISPDSASFLASVKNIGSLQACCHRWNLWHCVGHKIVFGYSILAMEGWQPTFLEIRNGSHAHDEASNSILHEWMISLCRFGSTAFISWRGQDCSCSCLLKIYLFYSQVLKSAWMLFGLIEHYRLVRLMKSNSAQHSLRCRSESDCAWETPLNTRFRGAPWRTIPLNLN